MKHWINAGSVKKTAAVAAVLFLFFWLALDPLLKWGLVKAGQAAAGAKVDIGSLSTSVTAGKLEIRGIAVANKNEPMKNLFELSEAVFQFSPGQALRGKVVIPQSGLKGFQLGTARKTSGALPRSKPSALESMVERQLAPAEKNLGGDVSKAKAAAAEVDPKKLESLKGLDAAQNELGKVGGQLKGQVGADKLDAQIKDLEAQIKQLQGGGNAPQDIARKAQLAGSLQGKIKALMAQVDQSRAAVGQQFAGVQSKLKSAEDLKHKDVNGLLAAAGLPTLDAESLTRHLLGPAASKKLSTAIYWISYVRKRAAPQQDKAAAPPPAARRRGVNIEFPQARSYPQFLLERAELSGKMAALFQGQDMDLQGVLTGVTSNPPLYGKPAQLTMKGAVPKGPSMSLVATVDQVKKPGATELQLRYAGLPLTGMALGDDQLGASLKGGLATLNGTIRIVGDQWNGTVLLQADQVSLEPKVTLAGPAAGFAKAALSGIRRFTLTIGISGVESDLHFHISSDLGQTVAEGMKKAFSGELAKQRKAVEDKVNALYAGRAKQLQAQTDEAQKKLLAPLDKQKAQLDDQLKRAVSQGLGKSIPGLNKLKLFK